jgi:hypothetical protein
MGSFFSHNPAPRCKGFCVVDLKLPNMTASQRLPPFFRQAFRVMSRSLFFPVFVSQGNGWQDSDGKLMVIVGRKTLSETRLKPLSIP